MNFLWSFPNLNEVLNIIEARKSAATKKLHTKTETKIQTILRIHKLPGGFTVSPKHVSLCCLVSVFLIVLFRLEGSLIYAHRFH